MIPLHVNAAPRSPRPALPGGTKRDGRQQQEDTWEGGGPRRVGLSGGAVAWRGTPNLDDWVAYIVNGTRSKKLILADHSSERKVKGLLSRLRTLSKKDIEKLAKD